jgi:hypothetical protein
VLSRRLSITQETLLDSHGLPSFFTIPSAKSKKRKESMALGNYIKQHRNEIVLYTRCEKSIDLDSKPRWYIAIPDSKYTRCAEYAW